MNSPKKYEYEIKGVLFTLNQDPTLYELKKIDAYSKKFQASGDELRVQLDSIDEYAEYMSLLVNPVDKSLDKSKFDFMQVTSGQAVQIISDFFLYSVQQTVKSPGYLQNLTKDFKKNLARRKA